MIAPLFGLGAAGLLYLVIVPLCLLQLFALLLIPSLLVPGARPLSAGKAVYCYLLQTLGIILMTIGGLPALYAVLERLVTGFERFSAEIYVALLLVFAVGGLTFLWHEHLAQSVDETSKRVSATVFWFTFKTLGYLLVLVSGLSFFLTLLLTHGAGGPAWWIMPILLLGFGLLLSWCTRFPKTAKMVPVKAATSSSMAKAKAPTKKKH